MFPPNEQISDGFWHSAGTGGLVDGDFTKVLVHNGIVRTDIHPVVTELVTGLYKYVFTPDAEGLWLATAYETTSPAVKYFSQYYVFSTVDALGGVNYDRQKHSLTNIRGAVQIVRDDQLRRGMRDGR